MVDSDKKESDPPEPGKWFRRWIYRQLGLPGLYILACVLAALGIWARWNDIRTWPGISSAVDHVLQDAVPQADSNRFSVLVAHLDDDSNDEHRRLIAVTVREFAGVQILNLDRTIAVEGSDPESVERAGHSEARTYLKESGASVLIWGSVLRYGGQSKLRLYMTAAVVEPSAAKQYTPEITAEFRLPELFWSDLASVLRLVIASRRAEFGNGHYVADRLPQFIASVQHLLDANVDDFGWDAEARMVALVILADALQTLGQQAGTNQPLQQSVVAYEAALREGRRTRAALDRAGILNNLGVALTTLGDRESDTARLEQAVVVLKEALKEFTRERVPLDWAATQSNLGNALTSLGTRKSGTARLEQAVLAYQEALKEQTREHVPLDWATTQNNLGTALLTLGERETGTARLEQAVVAHQEALKVYTRQRAPLDWAMTQNNLGNVLASLGGRESDTARLEQAVAAFKVALEEYTRKRVPLAWAMTQNNLGIALRRLGSRDSDTIRLEQAVAAFEAALEERKRELVPFDWAATQSNLGVALAMLAERDSGTDRLEQAVAAFRRALEVFKQEDASYYASGAQANLERAQAMLAQRQSQQTTLP